MDARGNLPIKTFDALLRDLVGHGLVFRDGQGPGSSWQLSDAAQRRLSELVQPSVAPAPEELVYLDHRCAGCRRRGATRLHRGLYLCEYCRGRESGAPLPAEAPAGDLAPLPAARRGRWRRHLPSAAGGGPLAS